MTNIVKQCIAWNEARYDRVLDLGLAISLLTEETEELLIANSIVEQLDAIGDISFVAIGVLWKAGFNEATISAMLGIGSELNISDCPISLMYENHGAFVAELGGERILDTNAKFVASNAAVLAIWYCMFKLKELGLQQEYFNIIKAICDSNDTKEVKGKTDPSVKANIVKGASFIPPTMALQHIISQYERITVQ